MNKELIKKELFGKKRKISIERALLYTEAFMSSDKKDDEIVKRARATANILNKTKISIRDGEILAGNRTIEPRAGIISPEMDPYWIDQEKFTIYNRPQDKFLFEKNDIEIFDKELLSYWKGNSLKDFIKPKIQDEVKKAIDDKIIKINQTDKGQGHIIPDYKYILDKGLESILEDITKKSYQYPENNFYKASIITLKALQNHILRYSHLADNMSLKEEGDRKKEILRIKESSLNIAYNKPRNFFEAIQLLWYLCVALQYESNASSISLGRFDQYIYSFYKDDIKKGIPQKELLEVLEAFFIKTNDVVLLRSEESAKFFAGFPTGYTLILGGIDSSGNNCVNEISFFCLEAYKNLKLPQPNIGVRLNKLTPDEFIVKTSEIIRLGTGIPQIFNDEIIIPSFLNRGVTLEDARDYAVVGCVELSIPGKTYGLHDIGMLNLTKIMEKSIHKNKEFSTFETFLDEIEKDIESYVKLITEGCNIVDLGHKEKAPTPLLSTFIEGCIDKGKDINFGGAKYNFSGVQGIGIPNLADSLMVIKKAVYEENRYTLPEISNILKNNFESFKGNEHLHRFINKYPKYGNDIDEVDNIAARILKKYCLEMEKYSNPRGGIFIPGSYTVSAHIPLGEVVGATPDGRKNGEQLADGGLSPMHGRDRIGPTAILKSVSKLDHYLLTNGSLLNVKFNPSTLAGETGIKNLMNYLKAFMNLKIQHIQFNVINRDILKKAQLEPEKFAGLVVRVAGYSAFFTDLNKDIQEDIIMRTEHNSW